MNLLYQYLQSNYISSGFAIYDWILLHPMYAYFLMYSSLYIFHSFRIYIVLPLFQNDLLVEQNVLD